MHIGKIVTALAMCHFFGFWKIGFKQPKIAGSTATVKGVKQDEQLIPAHQFLNQMDTANAGLLNNTVFRLARVC